VGSGICAKTFRTDIGNPLTDTLFLYIAWKYKPSQAVGEHPLWPCPLRVGSNFVRHSYLIHEVSPFVAAGFVSRPRVPDPSRVRQEKIPQPAKWIQGKMTDPEPSADVRLGMDSGKIWKNMEKYGKIWKNGGLPRVIYG